MASGGKKMKTKILGNKEKKGRRFTAPLALATVFLLIFASVAVVSGNDRNGTEITSLPYTISTPGEYYLSGDLTCYDSSAAGITVEAENVIIDGQGHKITGTTTPVDCQGQDPCHACGILNIGHDNLLIKDIEIEAFGTGIVLEGLSSNKIEANIIQDSKIHDNGFSIPSGGYQMITHGIHIVRAHGDAEVPGVIIKRNDVYNNHGTGSGCDVGGSGIFVRGGGSNPNDYVTVTCNKLYNNDKDGFWTKQQADHLEISYNEIYGNGIGPNMGSDKAGAICLQCASNNNCIVSYNRIHDNHYQWDISRGIFVRGQHNVIKCNYIINNDDRGIDMAMGDSDNNEIYDNVVKDHTTDVNVVAGATGNIGDNNCADTAINYQDTNPAQGEDFTYDTNSLVSCYYDFDFDGHYSAASCSSQNLLGVGSCCLPGQYDGSSEAMTHHEAYADCVWSEGADPNDCRAYTITGNLYESDGSTPLTGAIVTLTRVSPYPPVQIGRCTVAGSSYTANLEPELDINPWNMLRITATDSTETYEGWTDHKVHECDIAALGFSADVSLENYVLNYEPCFPFYPVEAGHPGWTGPAVMQSCIGHYIDPPSQETLDDEGRINNLLCNQGLLYVDPEGMETTMDDYLHPEGRNYGIYSYDNTEDGRNHALHKICYWQKLGPAAVPTLNGDYSNWMAVRGIRTDNIPDDYSAPYEYVVKGFWVNDPATGGIGENIYIDADTWNTTYYLPLTELTVPEDPYDDKYVCIVEPPEDDTVIPEAQITIVRPVAKFVDAIPTPLTKTILLDGTVVIAEVMEDDETLKVVQAAIDGVSAELLSFDAEFAEVFAKTVAGDPMLVSDEDGDYWLVPFNEPLKQIEVDPKPIFRKKLPVEIQKLNVNDKKEIKQVRKVEQNIEIIAEPVVLQEKTLVVVRIAVDDGRFLDASWVTEGVDYLPIDEAEALDLVLEKIYKPMPIYKRRQWEEPVPVIDLVYLSGSLYYPAWHITVGESEFFVSQDGAISHDL